MGPGMGLPENGQAMSSVTMLDWFATFAPGPSQVELDNERAQESNKRIQKDTYIMKSEMQIRCKLRYQWAKAMLEARKNYQ